MSVFSPKVLAYIRASEVIAETRAERGVYPKAEAAAINRELQAISKRLYQSAKNAYRGETLKKFFADHPDKAKLYKQATALQRYRNAVKAIDKLAEEDKEK